MPLAIAALGLTAAGTGMGIAGNMQAQDAINRTRANAVSKQAGLDRQAQAIAQKNIDQSTIEQANADMAKGQQRRQTAWDTLQKSSTPIASALPATTGTGTGKAAARAAGSANTWNTLNANAAAKEGSYGDWQTAQSVRNSDIAQKLGAINNFAQGDARVLPTELEVASHAGDELSGWGQIVSSLGMLTGIAGMAGLGGTAAKTAVTPISQVANYPMSDAMITGAANAQAASGIPASWTTMPTKFY